MFRHNKVARAFCTKKASEVSFVLEAIYKYVFSKNSKQNHTAFVEAFNKELGKVLFNPMDAKEIQDPQNVSAI